MEVVIVDANKSFGIKDATRKRMKRNNKGGDYIYEKGFSVGDINRDGKVEFIPLNDGAEIKINFIK